MVFLIHVPEGTVSPGVSPDRVLVMGIALLFVASLGFYAIEGLIDKDATGRMEVNAFYCAVMTLTTIGYGDICPTSTEQTGIEGKLFILIISFLGLGMICGPFLDVTAAIWRHQLLFPGGGGGGGILSLTMYTLGMGVCIFTYAEGLTLGEAVYASVITGTTIGYGDATPTTDIGKILVALYAIMVVNVWGSALQLSKEILMKFCMTPTKTAAIQQIPDPAAAAAETKQEEKDIKTKNEAKKEK